MVLMSCALAACQKPTTAAPSQATAAASTPAPASPPPVQAAAPVAPLSITGIDLGTVQGADRRVADPRSEFARSDTVVVAIATRASGGAVPGRLTARWSDAQGRTINEESRQSLFSGETVTDFRVAEPKGWPVGRYAVEVSLDGNPPQKREFVVR